MTDGLTWQLSDGDRRGAFVAAAAAFSAVLGPFGPLAVWGLEYLYDRRDLLFTSGGAPVRAYTAERSPLALSALATAAQSTVSVDTTLTDSARQLGLRQGDPVSLVLTGHRYTQARSGLVVPARIGERVNVTVPSGTYAIAAFGGRRDELFRAHDPYRTVAGDNFTVTGPRTLALPLTPRATQIPAWQRLNGTPATPAPGTAVPAWQRLNGMPATPAPGTAMPAWRQLHAPTPPKLAPAQRRPAALQVGRCLWCGLPQWPNPLQHTQNCLKRPRAPMITPPAATGVQRRQCDRCFSWLADAAQLDRHMRDFHPFVHWWRTV